jgi:hypothetical protein
MRFGDSTTDQMENEVGAGFREEVARSLSLMGVLWRCVRASVDVLPRPRQPIDNVAAC